MGLIAALLLGATLAAPGGAWPQEAAGRALAVIVNKQNTVDTLTDKELANIFLDKRSVWRDGVTILTCDLIEQGIAEERTARALFAEKYLQKDLYSLKSYWIKMIFSAKRRPPITFSHAGDVIRFVSENPGGIGYVYEDQVTADVNLVKIRLTGGG